MLTEIARARIGAFVKYAGYCEAKEIVPVFPSGVYGGIATKLLNNTAATVRRVDDRLFTKAGRVLELCHEEYLADDRLDGLSVTEVLKLRTAAWGRQAAAREKLFESVFQIAREASAHSSFEEQARIVIRAYHQSSEELTREREALNFQIKCEVAKGALGSGVSLVGLLSQLESPLPSIGLTLAAGAIWVLDKTQQYVPMLKELYRKQAEVRRGAAFGLHNFYSRLGSSK